MDQPIIDSSGEILELDSEAVAQVGGGTALYRTALSYRAAGAGTASGGPGGPRPIEDQIIWPDNPYDIIDMI